MAKESTRHSAARAKALPPAMVGMIATTNDGKDITRPWVHDLQQARDPRLNQSVDWGVYDRIRKDDQVKSCMEQRISAVVSAEWNVLPGDDQDPRSVEAAEAFKNNLERVGVDRFTTKMLWAQFNGYAVAEVKWIARDGLFQFDAIHVRHARRFRYDKENRLRLLTMSAPQGEIMPDRKFWVVTAGGTDDDETYGEGLADWLYWPTYFKRNGIRFWNIFLDKFGTPTAKATYRRGTPEPDIQKLLGALRALATDSGIVVPEGTAMELLQAARSGTGDFKELCRYMDEAIAKIILSQTMTTQDGSSLSQAKVHAGVKLEIVKADADLLCDSFNEGPARWWCEYNFGPDVAPPQLVRLVEEEADLKALAETDTIHATNGWVRSDESFKDTYGDGYEKKESTQSDALTDPVPPVGDNFGPPLDGTGDQQPAKDAASFAAADPRPLYVYRKLRNTRELLAWAKAQGFTSTVPADDLHVTIAYSRRPVNWFKVAGAGWGPSNGELIVPSGGPRIVDRLGDKAVVLHFTHGEIEWRHEEMVEKGCSWDFPSFQPHITISYDGAPADLAAIQAYQGKLVFGPEIYEPLGDDWQSGQQEASFADPTGDDIDAIVSDLIAEHGFTIMTPQLGAAIDAIEASDTPEALYENLLKSLGKSDATALTNIMARAGFAVRIAAEAGADQ